MRSIPLAIAALLSACTPSTPDPTVPGSDTTTGDDSSANEADLRAPAPAPTQRLAIGKGHACELRGGGEVWCWGRNAEGQCGVEGEAQIAAPRRVMLVGVARAVVAGARHTCAILAPAS